MQTDGQAGARYDRDEHDHEEAGCDGDGVLQIVLDAGLLFGGVCDAREQLAAKPKSPLNNRVI